MATYTHLEISVPSGLHWYNLEIDGDNPVSSSSTLLVLPNSDGTQTRITGTGFTFDLVTGEPTGGTVASIARTDASGVTTYEEVTGLSLSLVALVNAGEGNGPAFALIFAGVDAFNGWSGDDLFVGGASGDTFNGGGGFDLVSYDNSPAGLIADLGTPSNNTIGSFAQGDTYNLIEGLIGSAFDDTLRGNGQANTLIGGGGNDFLRGRGGADILDGGAGSDTADYFTTTPGTGLGITVDLANDDNNTGEAFGDTFISIENLRGSANDDTLRGNSGNNALDGHDGADTLEGGAGIDEVRYDRDFNNGGTAGVNVNLALGTATDGFGDTDTLVGIESIRGTSQIDTLTGGNAASYGFESYRGLNGADIITGGDGFDEVRYDLDALSGGTNGVTVNLAAGTANDGFGAIDTLSGIQSVRGTAQVDNLTGSDALGFFGEAFQGLAGADIITGALGFDEARYDQDVFTGGGAGVTVNLAMGSATDGFGHNDVLSGIEGALGTNQIDTLTGGAGFNFFSGLGGADIIDGGAGDTDEARYDRDAGAGGTAGVTVNLGAGTATDGFGNVDQLISMERVRGTAQADSLTGSDGDNALMGLGGADQLIGGLGLDEIRYDADFNSGGTAGVNVNLAMGTAIDGFGNTDTLTSIEQARGTRFADVFLGSAENNVFYGLAGNDSIDGGDGSDWTAYSNDIFNRDESQTLAAVVVNLGVGTATDSYGGADTLTSIENAAGGTLGDSLIGSASDNIFRGLAGNDTIDGVGGIDTVDYSADRRYGEAVFISGAAGVTVDLGAGTATDGFGNTDALTSIENAIGTEFADSLTGSASANVLTGGSGHDTLDGNGGADTLVGGLDDDTYVVNNLGVIVTENAGQGTDTVQTSLASYALGANVENLTGTSGGGQSLAGNSLNNTILGAGGNDIIEGLGGSDILNGGGGDDVIIGSDGSDTIDGGSGVDALIGLGGTNTMTGGAGDDVYYSSSASDVIVELAGAGEGNDVVVSNHSIVLSDNVERVILQGAATSVTGNGQDNLIFGLEVANGLTLDGAGGNDILYGSQQSDTLTGGTGTDTLLGFDGTNTMTGGAGDDTYFSYSATDTIIESAGVGEGIDQVISTHDITLSANVENLTLRGLAAVGIGNDEANELFGLESSNGLILNGMGGADVLIGSNQADLLTGGTGNDFMFGAAGEDAFQFASAGFGNDTITDFVTTAVNSAHDYVDLRGLGQSFGALNIAYSGAGATITIGADAIFLTGVTSGLQASDFLF